MNLAANQLTTTCASLDDDHVVITVVFFSLCPSEVWQFSPFSGQQQHLLHQDMMPNLT